jgi:hypothetical protein
VTTRNQYLSFAALSLSQIELKDFVSGTGKQETEEEKLRMPNGLSALLHCLSHRRSREIDLIHKLELGGNLRLK